MPYFWAILGMQLTLRDRPILGFRYTGLGSVFYSLSLFPLCRTYR